MASAAAVDGQTASQDISLVQGWNAVWLEVEPRYPATNARAGQAQDPVDVFPAGVTTVASPKPLTGLAEFFAADPTVSADLGDVTNTFNQTGWEQWNRTAGIDDDLVSVTGNRAYLIQASGPVNFTVTGVVKFAPPQWTPDRYNLLGFGIAGAPSFQEFFGPSGGRHPLGQIYTLEANGDWTVVTPTDPIGNQTAYWIYANGPSDYMGPVAVDFDLALTGTLNFAGPSDAVAVGSGVDQQVLDLETVVLTNLGGTDATPELELITAAPGQGNLALRVVEPAATNLAYTLGNQVDSTPDDGQSAALGETVAVQSTAILTLGAARDWTTGTVGRTNVYRLTTSTPGAQFWLPVSALNNEVQQATDLIPDSNAARVAGLWVGDVTIDSVTSIVEAGAPSRPSAGTNSFRLLMHSNATGAVTLLSQVTLMQTRTADAVVDPVPVLVTDPARIPFFEGIRERDGKRVGMRVESVAYDMPRRLDATSQSALLTAFPQLTVAGIPDFLQARTLRPPSLSETYHLSWAMEGALGSGKTVRTPAASPLVLDPFHRSNPFRHALHQRHPRGPNVTRTWTIVFDANQAIPDQLTGRFQETLQGVARTDLELSGRVELGRVSAVDVLNTAP